MYRRSCSRVLRRLFAPFACGLILVLLTLVAGAAGAAEAVRSASELDFPPFSIVTKDRKADGFAVEMLRESLRAMGREVQFAIGPWHKIRQDLAAGRIDVLPLVARTAARQDDFDFTAPYLSLHGSIVVRKGDGRIRRAEDLAGKVIVVMKGDSSEEYVRQFKLSDTIVATESLEEALRELAAGRHDALVAQTLAAENIIRTLGLSNLETVGPPLAHYHDYYFAVRKGNHELLATLNEGLSLVIANGTRERLREKWIAPTQSERIQGLVRNAAAALGALLMASLVAALWQRTLRRQVKARTAELAAASLQQPEEIRRRRRAESELEDSETLFRAVFDNAAVGIAQVSCDGRFMQVNPVFCAILGYTRDEMLSPGISFQQITFDEDLAANQANAKLLL